MQRAQLAEVGGRQRRPGAPRRAAWRARSRPSAGAHEPARDERDDVARPAAKPRRPGARGVGQLADHADDRRRVDRAAAALVVERDVAADDRDAERAAGVGEAGDRAGELPGDVRLLGVAEVQAVRQPERLGADAGEVRRALEHRLDRAAVRVAGDAAAVAVDRDRDRGRAAPGRRACEHGGVGLPPGRRTVREPTRQSYCSNAQRREARLARAEQREQRRRRRRAPSASTRGGAGYIGVAGAAGSRS